MGVQLGQHKLVLTAAGAPEGVGGSGTLGFLLGQHAGHVALGGGLGHGGQGAASSVMFSTRATRS